jgi:hypothetical protein
MPGWEPSIPSTIPVVVRTWFSIIEISELLEHDNMKRVRPRYMQLTALDILALLEIAGHQPQLAF